MESPHTYPVLYTFRRCPYAIRARMAMAASEQTCILREVVLADKPAALLQASPKGTVPVLVLPSGTVLEQSLDIMLWALGRNDPQSWLPAPGAAMDMTLRWISACDGPFKHALDRYKYPHRYALPDGMAHRTQGAEFLATLEPHLAEHGTLHAAGMALHGSVTSFTPRNPVMAPFGLADAAIAPFVRQFAHTDHAWFSSQPWPALQRWLAAFEVSAIFERVMEKYPRWEPSQYHVQFPMPT